MYETLALAALLHDIGKVGQRAFQAREGLSEISLGLADYLCPKDEIGLLTHLHVLYTNEFIEKIQSSLPKEINSSSLANLAAYHHKPADEKQKIISEADRLSSAMERESTFSTGKKDNFREIALKPVMISVLETQSEIPKQSKEFVLQPYSSNAIFPVESKLGNCSMSHYNNIWDNLIKTTLGLNLTQPIKYIDSLISILEKFLWAVPSATNIINPDISLFDHSKATSALAGCMFLAENKEFPFILMAGEFGGIQKYIFGVKSGSGKLAKALRGRSFKVNTLSDTTALAILNHLGLSMAHMVISAGGRFILILPNNADTHSTLKEYHHDLHNWIISETFGELRFNLVWNEYKPEDIKDFGAALNKIGERLAEASFEGLEPLKITKGWQEENWLLPRYEGEHKAICRSCMARTAENDSELCFKCNNDRKVGQKYVSAAFQSVFIDKKIGESLPFAGFHLYDKPSAEDETADIILEYRGVIPEKFNLPYFTLLKNNYVPRDLDGDILEFEEIAARAEGNHLLGYLKADIDNLGFIFSRGFTGDGKDGSKASISRLATLSRSLEYFFSGYLYHFLEKEFPDTYTVFSGGDDLLFIGPWDKMFRLADRLRQRFGEYTCDNCAWGLSAGIALVKPKTPLSYGLNEANRSLSLSKNHAKKDAITALNTTMSWSEFSQALSQSEKVAEWLKEKILNSAKVYRFLYYGEQLREFHQTGNTSFLRVIPQMIYDLTRNWPEKSDSERQAKAWAHTFTNPECPESRLLPFICQYALNKIRS